MGLNEIKKLHSKGNNYQNQETPYRMGKKIFASHSLAKGLISRIYK
jgi:hypothetical protein